MKALSQEKSVTICRCYQPTLHLHSSSIHVFMLHSLLCFFWLIEEEETTSISRFFFWLFFTKKKKIKWKVWSMGSMVVDDLMDALLLASPMHILKGNLWRPPFTFSLGLSIFFYSFFPIFELYMLWIYLIVLILCVLTWFWCIHRSFCAWSRCSFAVLFSKLPLLPPLGWAGFVEVGQILNYNHTNIWNL